MGAVLVINTFYNINPTHLKPYINYITYINTHFVFAIKLYYEHYIYIILLININSNIFF